MLLGTLAVSILRKALTGKVVIRAGVRFLSRSSFFRKALPVTNNIFY